ncbi:MAG: HAD-IC family P-type ATPase, partial [Clostridia bacterium]|nr:HAD-IC family P-type ATPase [Clostridia bacterium]
MKKNQYKQNYTERYNPEINSGLSDAQINERIANNLVNTSVKKHSKSYAKIFIDNFCTFFNFLGLIVAIALIFAKAEIQQFFFVLIYLANILIGIILEIRAKRCIDKLSLITESMVTAVRNGKEIKITYKDIVLDDILLLKLGMQIPTDCIIMQGEVEVNEAMLTGESVPVRKKSGDVLFAGSFIVSGNAYVKADCVGAENYIEKLTAKAKVYKKPYSEIMSTLKLLIKVVSIVIIPIAVAFMLKSILGHNIILTEAIKKTVTVVIGMIPSGMFLLTSVALAVGVIKLFKHNTLVQDLYSLEILARVDTICFDKTGTLTSGNMSVSKYLPFDKNYNENDIIYSIATALKAENSTEKALLQYFKSDNIMQVETAIPFNSTRKLSAVTFKNGETFSLGAPEFVLNKQEYSKIEKIVLKHTEKGERVLLLANSSSPIVNSEIPTNFKPVGLILIEDEIRENV